MELVGKTLVFTDQHFGVKGNSPLRQKIGVIAMKAMIDYIVANSIKNVIFAGDYFHQRNAITIDTLNIAHRCLQAMAKHTNVYMILGNHDLFNKHTTDVNSIKIFQDIDNVYVIDKPIECSLNGKKALFVPWLSDLSKYKTSSFDMMFGHFDISTKFLISNYTQEHSKFIKSSTKSMIEIDSIIDSTESIGTPGNFMELVKENGTIFAGHIHQHKEMRIKNRNFIFVGCPYQQNLGDIDCKCGYYVIDEHGKYEFNTIDCVPIHIQLRCGDIIKQGINTFDFSLVKGNIVQKVYDIDVSLQDDLEINQKISSYQPYEELLPEYKVELKLSNNTSDDKNSTLISMLKKSKLDYVKSYIDQLDDSALANEGIEKDKLFAVMQHHYNLVSED